MHGWNAWGWGHLLGMGRFWLLVLAALAVVLVALLRMSRGTATTTPRPSAEDLLRERYARGEIDAEQYQQPLAELRRE